MPIFKSLVRLEPEKSRHKRDSNPGSSAPEVDALATRPMRRCASLGRICSNNCTCSDTEVTDTCHTSTSVSHTIRTPGRPGRVATEVPLLKSPGPPRWPNGKASAPRERKVPGLNPACGGIFTGSSHTCDLNIGTQVATLPGAWRYKVSAGTGRPGVSIL